MKRFAQCHFLVGSLFFALFLLTGVYMLLSFPALYDGREEVRMMYRATHIYLLMSVLINLMAGFYLQHLKHSNYLRLRRAASLLILVTPPLFFAAFVVEPPGYAIDRPIAFWGVILLVGGVAIHAIPNLRWLNSAE